jgi:hypothetical protein
MELQEKAAHIDSLVSAKVTMQAMLSNRDEHIQHLEVCLSCNVS